MRPVPLYPPIGVGWERQYPKDLSKHLNNLKNKIMTQVKIKPLSKEEIQNLYKEHGKESKLFTDSGIETFMPSKVTFGIPKWQDMPNAEMSHVRIETFNPDNMAESGTVSLSRLHVLGVKKATPDQFLKPEDLVLRSIKKGKLAGKKTYMVSGKPLNPAMRMSEDETILNLQGKTFNVVKAERFNVPFEVWESKEQAIEATDKVAIYYELSEVQ